MRGAVNVGTKGEEEGREEDEDEEIGVEQRSSLLEDLGGGGMAYVGRREWWRIAVAHGGGFENCA